MFSCNEIVIRSSSGRIFTETAGIPKHRVALLLGTAPTFGGHPNPYFLARVDAAAKLYQSGKVEKILASGDHSKPNYDEPTAMKLALMKRGVPAQDIALDYAGLRTLDSVIRAKKVFGLSDVTLITDDFHLPRALYIARHEGLDAVGFQTRQLPPSISPKTWVREAGSRVLMFADLYLWNRQPKFLGKPEHV